MVVDFWEKLRLRRLVDFRTARSIDTGKNSCDVGFKFANTTAGRCLALGPTIYEPRAASGMTLLERDPWNGGSLPGVKLSSRCSQAKQALRALRMKLGADVAGLSSQLPCYSSI